MDIETGNASQEAPNSSNPESSSADFFAALDSEVNSGILDATDDSSLNFTSADNKEDGVVREVQQEDVETLKKRYANSSSEGKRLNNRLKEIEPYLPILDEMRKDPNLVSHVKGYFEGGGQTPQSVTEKLELDEDFIFDPDEAVTDPKSDSAKVLNSTIDGVVQKRLNDQVQQQREDAKVHSEIDAFRDKHNMSMDEWLEFKEYADSKPLSLDDILYLRQKEAGVEKAEPRSASSSRRASQHTQSVQERPRSLASTGSANVEVSEEDDVFDAIMGLDKQLESAFG
jgi:hypothetical protein